MRVSAGKYKGRSFSANSKTEIRPTTDRIKEWIFQFADPYIPDEPTLDLFSGSGNLGIEALSRGSSFAVFVDKNTGKLIRSNLESLQTDTPIRVYHEDVLRFLKRKFSNKFRFSLITADPPYTFSSYSEFLTALYQSDLLKPGGLFILESGKHSSLQIPESFYPIARQKLFGETNIHIFERGIE